MNQTHILVQLTDRICQVRVYDKNGGVCLASSLDVVFEGNTPYQGNTRKLKVQVHEAIVRYITRECVRVDISMRTPIVVL